MTLYTKTIVIILCDISQMLLELPEGNNLHCLLSKRDFKNLVFLELYFEDVEVHGIFRE